MIKATHHFFLYPFFEWYGQFLMKLHFSNIRITGNFTRGDLPVLVISNHFSWWDGFFISTLNRTTFHKKFHVMMLEEQLLKHWYFRHTGGYSIKTNSKSCIESLRYTTELLKKPENMITFFPQGRFESVYTQPLNFRKGIEWVLKHLNNDIQVIFTANLVEYFSSAKPELYIYFKEYAYQNKDITALQQDYNHFYKESYLDKLTQEYQ
ncbi:MAG: lysophospholipid acyltransferase family protein [Prolixibacteraceae bacterium]|jgi:1-acyl-sn-glycerol-3-phosphate acyltransferase|nr:lysophospholipid acyltransferase family protein [Prolixibacteraceae bacterium]